jgi:hypothetical protein
VVCIYNNPSRKRPDFPVAPERVRYAVQIEGLSHRAAARRFGTDPRTVTKMVRFTAPPGYVRTKPPAKPKLTRSSR